LTLPPTNVMVVSERWIGDVAPFLDGEAVQESHSRVSEELLDGFRDRGKGAGNLTRHFPLADERLPGVPGSQIKRLPKRFAGEGAWTQSGQWQRR
jgi:hypothetical protein